MIGRFSCQSVRSTSQQSEADRAASLNVNGAAANTRGFIAKAPQPVAGAQAEGIYPARSHVRNFSRVFVLVGCVSRNAASQRSGLLLRCELLTVTEQPQTDKSLQCTARSVPTLWCSLMVLGENVGLLEWLGHRVYIANSLDHIYIFIFSVDVMVFLLRLTLRQIERRKGITRRCQHFHFKPLSFVNYVNRLHFVSCATVFFSAGKVTIQLGFTSVRNFESTHFDFSGICQYPMARFWNFFLS